MNRSDPLSAAVRPFRLKLGLFAVLRALLASFAAGCFSCGAAVLACKIAQKSLRFVPPIAASVAAAAVFAAALIYYFPSRRETARRIDALGLKERASTMLAFRDDPSEIACLQRNDALRRIDTVKKRDLRAGIGMLPVILAAIALLFAVLCAVIPASWFERAENPLDEVWQQVLEMLREEEDRLGEQGEDILSDEMRDLIDSLEEMDPENVLRAVGEINGAEEAAKDAARNGEASREAMGEMLDVLEEARRTLLGEEEEEENGEGENGEMQPGMEMEGLMPGMGEEGEEGMPMNPDGEPRDGENGMGQGNGEPGENGVSLKTEPVYDPISGSVPYGDVFSAYYSEYLRDAEDGEIPFEVQEAAKAYFSSLDQ